MHLYLITARHINCPFLCTGNLQSFRKQKCAKRKNKTFLKTERNRIYKKVRKASPQFLQRSLCGARKSTNVCTLFRQRNLSKYVWIHSGIADQDWTLEGNVFFYFFPNSFQDIECMHFPVRIVGICFETPCFM